MIDEKSHQNRNGIGTLQENSLHADLIGWYAQPGDELEARREGYVIDIVRGEQLIEIQTRGFSTIKTKLNRLLDSHPVRLVYPIALEKWILRQASEGDRILYRRKSPRRGRVEHLFSELVRLPHLVVHPNFSLEVLFTREEEIQVDDGHGSWRRKGRSIADRRLVEVADRRLFSGPQDYLVLLPSGLPIEFTAKDLARQIHQPRYQAQKMLYCLRQMGAVRVSHTHGRAYLYSIEVQNGQSPEEC